MRLIHSLLATAAATAVFGAAPAHAQSYGVAISSSARAAHAGGAACDVNLSYGPNQVTCATPDDPGHVSATATTGSAATPGAATTATVNVHEDGPTYVYYGDPGGYAAATASTTVDLASASLHMSASVSDTNPGSADGTGSRASFSDTLHFAVAGAAADTRTTIGVSFTIDGTMSTTNQYGASEFFGALNFGGSNAQFYLGNFGNSATNPGQTTGTFSTYPAGFDNGVWTSNADYTVNTFTGTYTLIGATEDVSTLLSATLNCSGGQGGGASCNYGSAAISFQLPSDVSYTSASGVFLTAGTTGGGGTIAAPVPEPQTWALMIGGLGLIGGTLRRRRGANGAAGITGRRAA